MSGCLDDLTGAKYPAAISTRVPCEMAVDVRGLAAAENVSMHEFVRRAISERIARIATPVAIKDAELIDAATALGRDNPEATAAAREFKPHVLAHAKQARDWLEMFIEALEHGEQPGGASTHECLLQFKEQANAAADFAVLGGQAAAMVLKQAEQRAALVSA